MFSKGNISESPEVNENEEHVSLTFSALTFSDGKRIEIAHDDIVVFVGPNNAGKSAALKELEVLLGKNTPHTVIADAEVRKTGTPRDFEILLKAASIRSGDRANPHLAGYRYNISLAHIDHYWNRGLEHLIPFFCTRLPTETRITDSNAPNNIPTLDSPPQHPIHIIQRDDRIEARISGYFRRAFGQDLIVYHGGGSAVPLFVGQRPQPKKEEDRISATYLERVRQVAAPLQNQGDGMRSFVTVILHLLALETPSVILLDEPEAFLHPPQARLVGEFISQERRAKTQIFIATHSSDVLQGLLNGKSEHLRIIRIQRRNDVNHVRELDKTQAAEIAHDPLLKYSAVFQGIFHKHVFICESDADCLFYNSVLDVPTVRGEQQPDVLFIHAGGKHRMAKLAAALRALDVPVSVIADMDLLNEEITFKRIFETLGGNWHDIEKDWRSLKAAIEQHKPWLNAAEIAGEIRKELENVPSSGEFPRDRRQRIEKVFRKASPWDVVKQGGKSNIPSGQATSQFHRLDSACQDVGLWIVPVGELEGFCRSIEANHGPAWTQKVLETKNIATDQELAEARDFVKAVWNRAVTLGG